MNLMKILSIYDKNIENNFNYDSIITMNEGKISNVK